MTRFPIHICFHAIISYTYIRIIYENHGPVFVCHISYLPAFWSILKLGNERKILLNGRREYTATVSIYDFSHRNRMENEAFSGPYEWIENSMIIIITYTHHTNTYNRAERNNNKTAEAQPYWGFELVFSMDLRPYTIYLEIRKHGTTSHCLHNPSANQPRIKIMIIIVLSFTIIFWLPKEVFHFVVLVVQHIWCLLGFIFLAIWYGHFNTGPGDQAKGGFKVKATREKIIYGKREHKAQFTEI